MKETGKSVTREDKASGRGYAVGFGGLVEFVHSAAPQNSVHRARSAR